MCRVRHAWSAKCLMQSPPEWQDYRFPSKTLYRNETTERWCKFSTEMQIKLQHQCLGVQISASVWCFCCSWQDCEWVLLWTRTLGLERSPLHPCHKLKTYCLTSGGTANRASLLKFYSLTQLNFQCCSFVPLACSAWKKPWSLSGNWECALRAAMPDLSWSFLSLLFSIPHFLQHSLSNLQNVPALLWFLYYVIFIL